MTGSIAFCARCGTRLVDREEAGRVRPCCPAPGCGFVHYGNPVPVVAAIVEHGGDVLLVRSHGWPEKFFGLVTGFLEAGETPEEGVRREVREELGLDAEVRRLVGVYAFTPRNEVLVAYHVAATGEVALGEELAAYKRVPVDKLRPWPMGTGEAVRDWLARRAEETA